MVAVGKPWVRKPLVPQPLGAQPQGNVIGAKTDVAPPSTGKTIHGLLSAAAERSGAATALVAADGALLQYDALHARVESLVGRLRAAGVGPGDRVAIVLPSGTAMAIAVLAAACAGIACPLNPAYRSSEFKFYFGDLQPRALITFDGCEGPATELARARGMAIVDACAAPDAARVPHVSAASGDIALILHTSGTTSRPKMVPLSHANLCSSAASIAAWLALSPGDRCLNVMPLFHIHGLVGALLASLAAGASVVCARSFDSTEFFTQLREFGATWYTAVPTMHQAILARAASEAPPAALRFVRSSSAALPPPTAHGLARVFGAPVVEAYGMTEAAHQVCSTPLVPHGRPYGSVGPPVNCDVVVVDERGEPLPRGRTGEVTIRGANVMSGYAGDAGSGRAAFAKGRLRTGDLGRFDDHGYLHLEGRIKDIINRGGEKISPREIDEALIEHPAVAQAVAFAVPHERLGEDVAAAVVLHPNARADERALQHFVAARLADFKIPRRIAFVEAIATGPTGKVRRQDLAATIEFESRSHSAGDGLETAHATGGAFEAALGRIWCEVLKVPSAAPGDDFFALGGDSLLATRVIARVRRDCGRELTIAAFFEQSTLGAMAEAVAESALDARAHGRPA